MGSTAKNLKEKWEEFEVEMGGVLRREQLCAGVKLQPVRSSQTKLQAPSSRSRSKSWRRRRNGKSG